MTRYYFPTSRAHHALCMATDHGMEFARRFGKWERESLVHLTGATEYKLYVHDDSLHVLVPQDGDVGIDDNGEVFRHAKGGWWVQARDGDPHRLPFGQPRIVERGGRPFVMPEREGAVEG